MTAGLTNKLCYIYIYIHPLKSLRNNHLPPEWCVYIYTMYIYTCIYIYIYTPIPIMCGYVSASMHLFGFWMYALCVSVIKLGVMIIFMFTKIINLEL